MVKKNFKGGGADLFYTEAPTPRINSTPVKDLKIDKTYKALIPPLSQEEYSQLETNLINNGIREAISIWIDTIIDGHNRYEIAQKHNLPYDTISYDFQSEADVIHWIIKNQFGRRNLTAYDRAVLALRLKPVIAENAKKNQGTRSDIPQISARSSKEESNIPQISARSSEEETNIPQISARSSEEEFNIPQISARSSEEEFNIPQISARSLETRKELAKIAGVSHDTISKVEKIKQAATPEILVKLKRGDISINKAYQDIKAQEKRNASENDNPITKTPTTYKIKPKIFSKYFSNAMTSGEVDAIIEKALEAYFNNGGQ